MTTTKTKPKCSATTKKGTRCTRGTVNGGELCVAHLPKEEKESKGFGGAQPNAGRPPVPRATDVMRERVEAEADKVTGVFFEALKAKDHAVRLKAANDLLDRVYGKPKQQTELTGADGGAIEIAKGVHIPSNATVEELGQMADELSSRRKRGA